ncbi:hypothetical protein EVAR_28875_1 [Eumeta japonica]|uniref:Uncharacterized protein n=1 Tax=Eumeta variegata TaxID=151549 RepID=A0A4C1X1V5_EUMVA|nr:hypothetical protein EVAR_28875_1 [Eumeta japonica]
MSEGCVRTTADSISVNNAIPLFCRCAAIVGISEIAHLLSVVVAQRRLSPLQEEKEMGTEPCTQYSRYFTADGFADAFNAELRKLLEKAGQATCSTSRAPCKPRRHWTLSDVSQDGSRSRSGSAAGEALIAYDYTPKATSPLQLPDQTQLRQYSDRLHEVGGEIAEGGRSAHALLPATITALPRTLRDASEVRALLLSYDS